MKITFVLIFLWTLSYLGIPILALAQDPFPAQASWSARGEDPNSEFGYRACSAGDINASGYDAIIVGAPGYDKSRGKAYLYLGGPQGLSKSPAWTFEGEAEGDGFGDRVGWAGDLNGDGYDDVYVTASSWKHGLGKVYVFYGGPKGLPSRPSWTAEGKGPIPLSLGDCTVPVGDLRHSGYDDLAVGAYGYDGLRGELFIYNGSAQGLSQEPSWRAEGEARGDQFGYGVGPVGDLNGDGFDDLMVASKYHSSHFRQEGRAYLYLGSKTGLGSVKETLNGASFSANLGTRVYGLGSLAEGEHPFFAIAAPCSHAGAGEIRIYQGNASGFNKPAVMTLEASPGTKDFGFLLGPLGRIFSDAGLAFFASEQDANGGQLNIYSFKPGSLLCLQSLKSPLKGDRFGQWAAPAGDLRGLGRSDLIVSVGTDSGGRVDVYYQNEVSPSRNPDAGLGYFLGTQSGQRKRQRPQAPSGALNGRELRLKAIDEAIAAR